MTNSGKQTKSKKASSKASKTSSSSKVAANTSTASTSETASNDETAERSGLSWERRYSYFLLGSWAVVGFGVILYINNWHLSASVVMLCFGWIGALATTAFLWRTGLAIAEGTESIEELDVSEARRHELEAEKRSLLRAIKEIEFDRDLGKMSPDDAKEMMRFYRARAIDVIKELDGAEGQGLSVEERIERDLKARLAVEKAAKAKKVVSKPKAGHKSAPEKKSEDASAATNDSEADAEDTGETARKSEPSTDFGSAAPAESP